MQKILESLFGSSQANELQQASTPLVQPEYNQYALLAQAAISHQDWKAARTAYAEGLLVARQQENLQAQQFFLSGLGTVHYKELNFADAESSFLDALAIAQQIDQPVLIARSQINLGELFAAQKLWDRAQTYHEQALEIARISRDSTTITLALENLARAYMEQSNPTYAIHLLKEAVAIAQTAQNPRAGASVLGWLGQAHLAIGDRGTGRRMLEQAQRLAMQTGRENLAIQWVVALANTDLAENDYHSAIERYLAAEDLSRRVGRQPKHFYAEIALNLSVALRHLGRFDQSFSQAERALLHSQEMGDEIAIAQAIAALGLALQGQGRHETATEHLEQVLDYYARGILNNESGKAGILLALGKSQQRLRRTEAAQQTFNEALELARANDNPDREAEAMHLLGSVLAANQQHREAAALWRDSIRLFEQVGNSAAAARALCDLGNTRRLQGDLNAATTDFENALMLLNNIDDLVTRGLVLSNAANLYTQLGDVETAEAFYHDAIVIARDLRDVHSESVRLGNLAWFYVLTGRIRKAIDLFEQALNMSRRLNDPLLVAIQTNNMAYAYARDDQHDQAISHYRTAIADAERLEADRWLAVFQSNLGESLVEQDNLDEAQPLYDAALTTSEKLEDRENLIRTRHRLAHLLLRRERRAEARELAESAYDDARKMGYRKGQADAGRVLGNYYLGGNDEVNARKYFAEAHRLYAMIRDPLADQLRAYAS